MADEPALKRGQVWREVDPRMERFIRIEADPGSYVTIRAVVRVDGRWLDAPRSRSASANPSRFNGKRGGYSFVELDPARG